MGKKTGLNPFLKYLSRYLLEIGRDRKWLAETAGINHNTINSLYANNRWPKLDMSIKIAESLEMPLDYFITGDEQSAIMTPDIRAIVTLLQSLSDDEVREAKGAFQMWLMMTRRA